MSKSSGNKTTDFNIYHVLNHVFLSTVIPGFFVVLWFTGLITLATLKICFIGCIVVFIVLPFIFRYSHKLQRGILFLTFIAHPSSAALKAPNDFGLYGTRNFYVTHHDPIEEKDVTVGVWHILPNYLAKKFAKPLQLSENDIEQLSKAKQNNKTTDGIDTIETQILAEFAQVNATNEQQFYERMLHTIGSKVIFYLHGNSGSRAASHRVELYKLLRELGYHVIAFDYRCYGDSTEVAPSEAGLVRDAIAVYKYITNVTKSPIFAWGHSLGTGVVTHTMAALERQHIFGPRLLVLESPFNNIRDEVREHPFSKLFRSLPWFNYTIVDPMYDNQLRFESDVHIGGFPQPVLILHAEDDLVVPFKLGHQLYQQALSIRKKSWGPIEFHRFDSSSGFGHKFICRAPDLPDILSHFFDTYKNEKFQ